jgi:hypothetical protein
MPKKAATQSEPKLSMARVMALKKKSLESSGTVWIKLGLNKLELPVPAHVLEADGHLFLSLKGGSSIYRINKDTKKLENPSNMDDAFKKLSAATRSTKTKAKAPEVPPELMAELDKLQKKMAGAGYKIGYDPKAGNVKIVKPRQKKK